MDISTMTLEQVEERLSAIAVEKDNENADLEALADEVRALGERKDTLLAEVEQRKKDMESVLNGAGEKIKDFGKEEKRMNKTIDELRNSAEYIEAYANYIKTGKDNEVRTLATELAANGTIPVPQIVLDVVETAWDNSNGILARVRRMDLKGILEIPYEVSATGADIHPEGTDRLAEEQLVIATAKLTPQTIKKWIRITDETLSMKSDVFLRYIYDELTHHIIAKLENDIVANLTRATNADGLTSTAVTSGADFSTVFKALAVLSDRAVNPVVVMNKQLFFNVFMSLTDSAQRPIYNIVAENGKPQYILSGVPVVFNNTLPATATGTYMVAGDFDGYTVNYIDGQDVKIITDPYSEAPDDRVVFTGKLYVGHGITRPNYFARVTAA